MLSCIYIFNFILAFAKRYYSKMLQFKEKYRKIKKTQTFNNMNGAKLGCGGGGSNNIGLLSTSVSM